MPLSSLSLTQQKRKIYSETDVVVDAPIGKTLFDECEWRGFASIRCIPFKKYLVKGYTFLYYLLMYNDTWVHCMK